jgi:hypothetical protein
MLQISETPNPQRELTDVPQFPESPMLQSSKKRKPTYPNSPMLQLPERRKPINPKSPMLQYPNAPRRGKRFISDDPKSLELIKELYGKSTVGEISKATGWDGPVSIGQAIQSKKRNRAHHRPAHLRD